MNDFNIKEILSNPISSNSHFLGSAPIITLGNNYKDEKNNINNLYTLLHEYIHYESYIIFPFLSINYFYKTYTNLYELYNFKNPLKNNLGYKDTQIYNWSIKNFNFKTEYFYKSDKNYEISKIGLDILLEASALLNYLIKPKKDELYNYSNSIINNLLAYETNESNVIYKIATQTMISIKNDIKKKFLHVFNIFGTETLETLQAIIPSRIAIGTFGYSMILNGFNSSNLEWSDINNFIIDNYFEVWDKYLEKIDSIYKDVILNNNYLEFLKIIYLRDLSVIGFHCFLLQTYLAFFKKFSEIYENNYKLIMIFLSPLLNIIKYYEAVYKPTLIKSKVPKLYNLNVPIPVILFKTNALTSINIEYKNESEFFFKWGSKLKYWEDIYPVYYWILMLFSNAFFNTIKNNESNIACPIWEWAEYNLSKVGINDIKSIELFCNKFCIGSLGLDIDLQTRIYGFNPTKDYCNFDLKNLNNKTKMCLFHNLVKYLVDL